MSNQPYVFISHATVEPDIGIAREFKGALEHAGCQVFLASDSIMISDYWPQQIDDALKRCDILLLLLTESSAISDWVAEEVQRARERWHSRTDGKPIIAPVRVEFPHGAYIPYDLACYIGRVQQSVWTSATDTAAIVAALLKLTTQESGDGEEAFAQPALPDRIVTFSAPVPSAEPIIPSGQLELASAYYIKRRVDDKCSTYILNPSAVIRIKAPRQMGKSSLLARVLARAQETGIATASLTLQLLSTRTLSSEDGLFRWFCQRVAIQSGVPEAVQQCWIRDGDVVVNSTDCLEFILSRLRQPLLVGVDEADRVFGNIELAANFFGMLRGWMDSYKNEPIWQRLRLAIAHSTEAYNLLPVNQSPFNIGDQVELSDLDAPEVVDLAGRWGLVWTEDREVAELMAVVGGHPYLVHSAIYEIAKRKRTLSSLTYS